ncbi:MAG: transketolase, partial [Tannerella sp.]|nr:transketolase [Tannerella sp.]
MNNEKTMKLAADNIRILAASMVEKAKSGHPGGSMGGADFINTLYSEFLNYNPDKPDYLYRDRFFLDPGHMSPMLYSTLALAGLLPLKEVENFRQWGSLTPGHPEVDVLHGIENTSGPLGQGHAMALGAAIAERFMVARFGEWMAHKTYTYISDGGIQEEISQGAGRIAGHLGLNNLIMYYDSNNIQLSTRVDEVNSEDVAAKYKAWNWNVITIDGNSVDEIRRALTEANAEKERPTIIIGKTVMAKGAVDADGNSYENTISTHGQPLSAAGADFNATIRNLGGNPKSPFAIFPEVEALYAERREQLIQWAQETAREEEKFRAENAELAAKLDMFLSGELPEIDYAMLAISIQSSTATRSASSAMRSFYAQNV